MSCRLTLRQLDYFVTELLVNKWQSGLLLEFLDVELVLVALAFGFSDPHDLPLPPSHTDDLARLLERADESSPLYFSIGEIDHVSPANPVGDWHVPRVAR